MSNQRTFFRSDDLFPALWTWVSVDDEIWSHRRSDGAYRIQPSVHRRYLIRGVGEWGFRLQSASFRTGMRRRLGLVVVVNADGGSFSAAISYSII